MELRAGATAPFLQMLHSTTSTVGTGRQESLTAGRLVFRGVVRLGGPIHDEDGLGRSGGREQRQQQPCSLLKIAFRVMQSP